MNYVVLLFLLFCFVGSASCLAIASVKGQPARALKAFRENEGPGPEPEPEPDYEYEPEPEPEPEPPGSIEDTDSIIENSMCFKINIIVYS